MYELIQLWWKFHFWFVKWFAMKPMVELNWIINGKYGKSKKWYHSKFNGIPNWKWLSDNSNNILKYVFNNG